MFISRYDDGPVPTVKSVCYAVYRDHRRWMWVVGFTSAKHNEMKDFVDGLQKKDPTHVTGEFHAFDKPSITLFRMFSLATPCVNGEYSIKWCIWVSDEVETQTTCHISDWITEPDRREQASFISRDKEIQGTILKKIYSRRRLIQYLRQNPARVILLGRDRMFTDDWFDSENISCCLRRR